LDLIGPLGEVRNQSDELKILCQVDSTDRCTEYTVT